MPADNNGASARTADLSVRGLLLDVDRFASHDGPGIRTAVFLKGCSLACVWCHSPESQLNRPEILYQDERCTACWLCLDVCPESAPTKGERSGGDVAVLDRAACTACGLCVDVCYPGALAIGGTSVTVGELVSDVERQLPYFRSSGGGVTLSGGEPARQFKFSYNFLLACKEREIPTALETTGYARWAAMSTLASVTDLLLYDIKLIDPASHLRHVGVPNQMILQNLERLAALDRDIQVRVPCIPGISDAADQIAAIARFVARLEISKIVLLPYNSAAGAKYRWIDLPYTLSDKEAQSEEYMDSLADVCRREGLTVQVGG